MAAKGIAGCLGGIIPGTISVLDFTMAARVDRVSARAILERLAASGIGARSGGDTYEFAAGDRLRAAVLAVREDGAGIDEVSERIGWRDFEGLVAEVLDSRGFETERNLRVKGDGGQRAEIDVAGTRDGIALLVDCKHWRRSSASALDAAARRQAGRARLYVAAGAGAPAALPAIVTLHEDGIEFAGRVPIVPVLKLGSFADELYGNMEGLDLA